MRAAFLALFGLVLFILPLKAATVSLDGFTEDGAAVVTLSGAIEDGDHRRLLSVTSTVQRAVVILDSKGGLVIEAIRIGEIVRARGFATYVPANTECTSSCGTVWLAGQTRLLDWSSQVGFHAAYKREGLAVSGSANALFGAFLHSIGAGYDLVAFVAEADPKTIAWLTVETATKMGMSFAIALPEQVKVKDSRAAPNTLVPVAATANGDRYACDFPTTNLILDAGGKDRDAREAIAKEYSTYIKRRCSSVLDGANLVIESFHTELPLACVQLDADSGCLWMRLWDLTVKPGGLVWPRSSNRPAAVAPGPSKSGPDAQTASLPGLQRIVMTRLRSFSEREICQMVLSGEDGAGQEFQTLLSHELDRRKLTRQRCEAGEVCAEPAKMRTAKLVDALACDDKLADVPLAVLCSAWLGPGRDNPALYWVRAEIRQRVVDTVDCAKLLGLQPAPAAQGMATSQLEAAVRDALPGLPDPQRDRVAKSYVAMSGQRALARSEKGTWRMGSSGPRDDAEITALEACQIHYAQPCWLVAVNDTVKPPQALGNDSARDMPKVSYEGSFDPARIPVISRSRRMSQDVTEYALARAGKASAIHARGIFVIVTDAPSGFEAERRALEICTAAVAVTPPAGPCLLYSSGGEVVLVRRSNRPVSAQPG